MLGRGLVEVGRWWRGCRLGEGGAGAKSGQLGVLGPRWL